MNEGLKTLIRLQNWKVDEMRRSQGALESQRAEYVQAIAQLDADTEREKQAAPNTDLPSDFGTYMQRVIVEKEAYNAQIAEVDVEIDKIANILSELFQELKRYEIALESRERVEEEEQKRKDQLDLDEISMKMHSRKEAGHLV